MRCPNCGMEVKPGAKFCGKCGHIIPETSASSSPVSPFAKEEPRRFVSKIYDSRVNRMPQGIAMGTDEKIVKEYRIGRYTFRQGAIDVIVTNKRVIRYEESKCFGLQNNQIDEINLDAVHGVSVSMMRSISILGLSFAVLFLIIGITGISAMSSRGGYGYSPMGGMGWLLPVIGFGGCALILVNSFKPSLIFHLHGAIGAPALNTFVNIRGRLFGQNNAGTVFQFKPTPETTVMLKELGACIYDLKTLGDAAIEKWNH